LERRVSVKVDVFLIAGVRDLEEVDEPANVASFDLGVFPLTVLASRNFVIHTPFVFHVSAVRLGNALMACQAMLQHEPDIVQPDDARHYAASKY
jgi:hypothetical protein